MSGEAISGPSVTNRLTLKADEEVLEGDMLAI